MKRTTTVVDLKARLSEYLRLVKAGHELVITERGVPVARVLPLDDGERRSTRRLRLTRSGVLKPGRGKLPAVLKRAPSGKNEGAGVLAALLAERGDASSDR
jgi:prevent-host-death family protein